jgi:hypothetical protein
VGHQFIEDAQHAQPFALTEPVDLFVVFGNLDAQHFALWHRHIRSPRLSEITAHPALAATGDRIYCVYIAPDEHSVREHAERGGFPADRISEVITMIDPTTAEAR